MHIYLYLLNFLLFVTILLGSIDLWFVKSTQKETPFCCLFTIIFDYDLRFLHVYILFWIFKKIFWLYIVLPYILKIVGLDGPCSFQLFNTFILILNFAKRAMPTYEEPWKIRELVRCIWYACVSKIITMRKRRVQIGSVQQKSTGVWPPIWSTEHWALVCTHTHMCTGQWTPSWWNHIGWRLCQVNNTAWSLMLNFLEVPTHLSTSCTCSPLQLLLGCTVDWMEIRESIAPLCLPAGHSETPV